MSYHHTGAKQDPNRKNYINHIALVLDGSSSMAHLTKTLITVADDLVAHLAHKSKELDQETRVTVYTFADKVECVIFDKDVLRLPSIADLYEPYGNTALLDATAQSVADLRKTMTTYGDHAFLTYVLTDGEENRSYKTTPHQLSTLLNSLQDNETVACLVPDDRGVQYARRFGFAPDNITKWEATTKEGLVEAGATITRSVDSYMESRVLGVRSTKSVFKTDLTAVNKATVNAKNLTSLSRDAYTLVDVKANSPLVIRDFVESLDNGNGAKHTYQIGKAFYQLSKTEIIQTSKQIAIQNIHSGRIYTGQQARDVLGLPDVDARVKPNANDEYRIYVQSTSVNRKLVPNTKLLLMK